MKNRGRIFSRLMRAAGANYFPVERPICLGRQDEVGTQTGASVSGRIFLRRWARLEGALANNVGAQDAARSRRPGARPSPCSGVVWQNSQNVPARSLFRTRHAEGRVHRPDTSPVPPRPAPLPEFRPDNHFAGSHFGSWVTRYSLVGLERLACCVRRVSAAPAARYCSTSRASGRSIRDLRRSSSAFASASSISRASSCAWA
jgi:hypothetical protein